MDIGNMPDIVEGSKEQVKRCIICKVRRELRDTRRAAILSAIELLHRLGLTGEEAEIFWQNEQEPEIG